MKVLVACEFSGIVRDAFIAKGHDAVSCDLLPTERPGPHIQDDVLHVLDDRWDMMIAHPPCTYLSYAGNRVWNEPGRVWKRLDALTFFAKLWTAPIEKICIENPLSCASPVIAKYSQIIDPTQFGEGRSKATYLWLRNLPPLMQTFTGAVNVESTKVPGNWYNKGGKDRQKNRAKTFHGIANAMAEQWG